MYRIKVVVGSVCSTADQVAYIQVNGNSIINGASFGKGKIYTAVGDVQVNNRIIKLTSYCVGGEYCTNTQTTIQMLSVKLI